MALYLHMKHDMTEKKETNWGPGRELVPALFKRGARADPEILEREIFKKHACFKTKTHSVFHVLSTVVNAIKS